MAYTQQTWADADASKPLSAARMTVIENGINAAAATADAATPATRTIATGTGLTGGGDLSVNRTLTVAYGSGAGTAAQGNDSRITGAVQTSTKNAANGVAGLDASGDIALAQLPGAYVPIIVGDGSSTIPTRPAYSGPVMWKTSATPPTGGTIAGGTATAVAGLDLWLGTS